MFNTSYSFDDILIIPRCSSVPSRNDISLVPLPLGQFDHSINLPFISSPMLTVTGETLAKELVSAGGFPVIPRRQHVKEQLRLSEGLSSLSDFGSNQIYPHAIATGLDKERIDKLLASGVRTIVVDVAFGANIRTIETVRYIKDNAGVSVFVIAGNTAAVEDSAALLDAGADALRVGIGGGAACTTRLVTGVGVPTFQSIINAYDARKIIFGDNTRLINKHPIIADGGIRSPGDACKSFVAGADFVMMGSQFAGTRESPGKIVSLNGIMYKPYAGMASSLSNPSSSFIEGDSGLVPVAGSVKHVLNNYTAGLRSAMSYIGVSSMAQLRHYVEGTSPKNRFTLVTASSLKESNIRLEK